MGETELSKSILNAINKLPFAYFWRNNVGRRGGIVFGFAGLADIIGVFAGRFVAIEVKFGKGKQKPEQETFQRNVERCNGIYILAYSLDDVLMGLK